MSAFSIGETPISGESVVNFLSSNLEGDELCIVRYVETLCTENCEGLGKLWHEVTEHQNVEMTISELVSVLINANQVITLHVSIKNSPNQELVIDDGELVENTIPPNP